MSTVKKPILGITMGDPFGNGPEITVRALADETVYDRCRPLVVGDAASMEYAAAVYNKLTGAAIRVHSVQSVQEAQFVPGTIDVLTLGVVKAEDIPCTAEEPKPFGLGATALGGEAAFQYVKRVIELALAGRGGCDRHERFEQGSHQHGGPPLLGPHRNLRALHEHR